MSGQRPSRSAIAAALTAHGITTRVEVIDALAAAAPRGRAELAEACAVNVIGYSSLSDAARSDACARILAASAPRRGAPPRTLEAVVVPLAPPDEPRVVAMRAILGDSLTTEAARAALAVHGGNVDAAVSALLDAGPARPAPVDVGALATSAARMRVSDGGGGRPSSVGSDDALASRGDGERRPPAAPAGGRAPVALGASPSTRPRPLNVLRGDGGDGSGGGGGSSAANPPRGAAAVADPRPPPPLRSAAARESARELAPASAPAAAPQPLRPGAATAAAAAAVAALRSVLPDLSDADARFAVAKCGGDVDAAAAYALSGSLIEDAALARAAAARAAAVAAAAAAAGGGGLGGAGCGDLDAFDRAALKPRVLARYDETPDTTGKVYAPKVAWDAEGKGRGGGPRGKELRYRDGVAMWVRKGEKTFTVDDSPPPDPSTVVSLKIKKKGQGGASPAFK